jgi:hypothetical protein
MTKKRAGSMDQTSSWTFDAAGAPGKLRRSPMASPEPGRMLAFASFQGSSGECQVICCGGGSASRPDRKHGMMVALHCLVLP